MKLVSYSFIISSVGETCFGTMGRLDQSDTTASQKTDQQIRQLPKKVRYNAFMPTRSDDVAPLHWPVQIVLKADWCTVDTSLHLNTRHDCDRCQKSHIDTIDEQIYG
uniref:SFRICE_016000 n=1 Tax=Spodoptera frugiperda TaxID=7108 RepID=A0A2H1W845_SPOFR